MLYDIPDEYLRALNVILQNYVFIHYPQRYKNYYGEPKGDCKSESDKRKENK